MSIRFLCPTRTPSSWRRSSSSCRSRATLIPSNVAVYCDNRRADNHSETDSGWRGNEQIVDINCPTEACSHWLAGLVGKGAALHDECVSLATVIMKYVEIIGRGHADCERRDRYVIRHKFRALQAAGRQAGRQAGDFRRQSCVPAPRLSRLHTRHTRKSHISPAGRARGQLSATSASPLPVATQGVSLARVYICVCACAAVLTGRARRPSDGPSSACAPRADHERALNMLA